MKLLQNSYYIQLIYFISSIIIKCNMCSYKCHICLVSQLFHIHVEHLSVHTNLYYLSTLVFIIYVYNVNCIHIFNVITFERSILSKIAQSKRWQMFQSTCCRFVKSLESSQKTVIFCKVFESLNGAWRRSSPY